MLKLYISLLFATLFFSSCNHQFKSNDYVAYFGGEIVNPNNPYVLFCKNNEVIDTLKLDKNNRFFVQFDSLAPGMYSFKHEPEFQYVYFDKNDSIMVRANAKDFDGTAAFCGRGDEKNNFLIELYLKNELDKNAVFPAFDYDINRFNQIIDSSYNATKKYYTTKKAAIKWGDDFDIYAKASLDYNYFLKKELYPILHKLRTGVDVFETLPPHYYDYRKKIDCNSELLSDFSPFVTYLSYMLNNMGAITYHNHYSNQDLTLKTKINELRIADTLFKNEKIKNTILNNIAFTYLLQDQNMINNNKFFEIYHKFSTDKSKKNEILKFRESIQLLKENNTLPDVPLMNSKGEMVNSSNYTTQKTVIFFWTSNAISHLEAVHKKVLAFSKEHPSYQFIGINLNDSESDWQNVLAKYQFEGTTELRCTDFENLKNKWVINKIYRAMILGNHGTIQNAFANIFELNFENQLK